MAKENTITIARTLAELVSIKEGCYIRMSEYPVDKLVVNPEGLPGQRDIHGRLYFDYGLETNTKFYAFRNRKEQCDYLRDRM